MPYDWGPHYIVPSEILKNFSGVVRLREQYDEQLLDKELEQLGIHGPITRVSNPWYYRKKGTHTWIKIGESSDRSENFAVTWDTTKMEDGQYEVFGMMHVFVRVDDVERVIARENVVEVTVEH
ncbi:MAG: hypothetical protein KAT75_10395 [Dehalococcoidia bacterium]|nr:hypothetical protein [Dehalococcoidia bacterium]